MKILTVSDTVSQELLESAELYERCRDVDLIFSCGDLPPEFLSALRNRYDVPLLYILGNHDLRYNTAPPVGCQSADRRIIEVGKLRILGFSGSRWYNGGPNQYTEKEMGSFIGKMRLAMWRKGGPDIVITHAPPRHIHDAEDPCHKGFKKFNRLIAKYNPSFFIHGHIHRTFANDSERITVVNSTKVINSYGFYVFEI